MLLPGEGLPRQELRGQLTIAGASLYQAAFEAAAQPTISQDYIGKPVTCHTLSYERTEFWRQIDYTDPNPVVHEMVEVSLLSPALEPDIRADRYYVHNDEERARILDVAQETDAILLSNEFDISLLDTDAFMTTYTFTKENGYSRSINTHTGTVSDHDLQQALSLVLAANVNAEMTEWKHYFRDDMPLHGLESARYLTNFMEYLEEREAQQLRRMMHYMQGVSGEYTINTSAQRYFTQLPNRVVEIMGNELTYVTDRLAEVKGALLLQSPQSNVN